YKLSTWIAKITKNLCINMANSQKVCTLSMDELGSYGFVLADDANPEQILTQRETLKCLRSEVDRLPEKYREPIMLYYFDGLSYNEIALKIDVPMTIVKNRIYRAKIMLRSKENILEGSNI
ncbi:MAG TPA: sigma-70 family RNA polymerase sigma factor, partial [Clostridia bacterium]